MSKYPNAVNLSTIDASILHASCFSQLRELSRLILFIVLANGALNNVPRNITVSLLSSFVFFIARLARFSNCSNDLYRAWKASNVISVVLKFSSRKTVNILADGLFCKAWQKSKDNVRTHSLITFRHLLFATIEVATRWRQSLYILLSLRQNNPNFSTKYPLMFARVSKQKSSRSLLISSISKSLILLHFSYSFKK